MTDDDVIRVNDVEYELVDGGYSIKPATNGLVFLEVRPKRVQTGWICRKCLMAPCLVMNIAHHDSSRESYQCPACYVRSARGPPSWVPFYGSVNE